MGVRYVHGSHERRQVHADSPLSDIHTLCGLDLEGGPPDGTLLPTETAITCYRCKAIIRHCKHIRAENIEPSKNGDV